jgi:squalene cyclase
MGICAASASALAAPPDQLGPTDIQRSIDKARDYLLKQQKPDGTWEAMRSSNKSAGATALVMLALANSGVPATEPPMQRALAWMRTQQPDETYSVALQAMILAMLAPETDRAILERNVEWLERAQVKQGPATGSWTYKQNEGRGIGDNSNSQFALLGLHEAARAGVTVSQDT